MIEWYEPLIVNVDAFHLRVSTDAALSLASAVQPLQAARPRQPVACAEFGPGFVRMPGSNSCIRMGGGVGLDVGAVP